MQNTNCLLMVPPVDFAFNPQTATTSITHTRPQGIRPRCVARPWPSIEPLWVLFQSTFAHLEDHQKACLGRLLPVTILTIEAIGDGSARCMLAEIFLPC